MPLVLKVCTVCLELCEARTLRGGVCPACRRDQQPRSRPPHEQLSLIGLVDEREDAA